MNNPLFLRWKIGLDKSVFTQVYTVTEVPIYAGSEVVRLSLLSAK